MKRLKKLRNLMAERGLRHVLLTDPLDIYYYTGYKPVDIAFFLVSPMSAKLFAFQLDNETETLNFDVSLIKGLKELKVLRKYKRIGYDSVSMNSRIYRKLRGFGIRLKDETDMIREPRRTKEAGEIEKISKAVRITKSILRELKISGTEKGLAKDIDIEIRKRDCSNAFDTIVSAGKNGYFIHHRPSRKRISDRDLVVVDAGAKFDEYCADVTRTFCKKPGKREKEVMENMKNIHDRLLDSIRDGVKVKEVQDLYGKLMKKNGYRVMHSFGHGVGLSVHESLGRVLRKNMVITIEPGMYIKKFGGCRIEDMVLVRKGKAKIF